MALSEAEGLRCAASFITAAYGKYASFLRICTPWIWSFFLCHRILIGKCPASPALLAGEP